VSWLDLAPRPRPKPSDVDRFEKLSIEWDVFISYRSSNRRWAIALRDQLVEKGFSVFLDQFVLRPGMELDETLEESLNRSGSGVLVLSRDVATSDWVKNEQRKMQELAEARAGGALPFNCVIARIDAAPLPFTQKGVLYSDFSKATRMGRGARSSSG
jgi:hypothetical protein